jgi:hypothetical protein
MGELTFAEALWLVGRLGGCDSAWVLIHLNGMRFMHRSTGIAYPPSCSIRWGTDERRPITRHAVADGARNASFESAFFPRNLPFIEQR